MTETIILVTGGFDPIHSGHISYFKRAKDLSNYLVVGLNGDPSSFFSPFPSSLFYASTLRDKSSAGASSRRPCISSKKFSRIITVCCLKANTLAGELTHSCLFPRKQKRKKHELWQGTKVFQSFRCRLFLLLVEQKPSKFDHKHENLRR